MSRKSGKPLLLERRKAWIAELSDNKHGMRDVAKQAIDGIEEDLDREYPGWREENGAATFTIL